jgi:hypothetical protein
MNKKQSDYSFMKSGFDNLTESKEETIKNATALMVHFMENAMNTASIYSNHAKRREIVSEDIKRSLMLEVFFFQKRTDLENKINEVKQELYDADSDSEEDVNISTNDGVDNNEFIESKCKCALCNCINTIYTRWESWTPETPMHIIIKEKLDNWDNLF